MVKVARLIKLSLQLPLTATILIGLVACQPTNSATSQSSVQSDKSDKIAQDNQSDHSQITGSVSLPASTVNTATDASTLDASNISLPHPTIDKPVAMDWQRIDSGVSKVDPKGFTYHFAIDSEPVKNYMKAYHVDAQTARYNLTVGMSVNELLDKVLDQVGTAYVRHELTAGKDSKLVIHTTPAIKPSSHEYVFAEPFARGLTITVQILADGKK